MEIKLKELNMSKNFNIKPSDAKYSINEEKRTVVCILEKTDNLFIKFVWENSNIGCYGEKFLNKLIMPNRFIGIAKCSEDDEWDVEKGKLIAFSRAKDKLNKSFFKRAKTYVNYIDRQIDNFVDIINTVGEKLEINQEHRYNLIDKLLQ